MEKEPETIDVEVVSIDGVAPVVPERTPDPEPRANYGDWRSWQGRVRTLDMRWWPLWAFLGVILLFLLLTVGVVFAVIYAVFRIIRGILSAFFSILSPNAGR